MPYHDHDEIDDWVSECVRVFGRGVPQSYPLAPYGLYDDEDAQMIDYDDYNDDRDDVGVTHIVVRHDVPS